MFMLRMVFTIVAILLMSPANITAFDFDAEMGGGRESSPAAMKHKSSALKSSFDFDAEMSHGRQQIAPAQKQSGDILDSIMGGRADIKDQESIHSFATLSQDLDQTCHCSISGKDCSGVMNLSSYQTKEYLNKAVALIKKVENLCFNWAESKEQSFYSAKKRNQFIKVWQSNKNILSAHQQSLSTILRSDAKQYAYLEQEKQKRIEAERQRAENKGGFQTGKFAALLTGAAIGGLGDLDVQSQTNILGGMLMDSMEGQKGISNTQSGANLSNQQIQQRNAENRRIQALHQQAAEARRKQLAENTRLRRLDAENRQRHQQAERAYRQRQIAQARQGQQQSTHSNDSQTSYQKVASSSGYKPYDASSGNKKSSSLAYEENASSPPTLSTRQTTPSATQSPKEIDEKVWIAKERAVICRKGPRTYQGTLVKSENNEGFACKGGVVSLGGDWRLEAHSLRSAAQRADCAFWRKKSISGNNIVLFCGQAYNPKYIVGVWYNASVGSLESQRLTYKCSARKYDSSPSCTPN